MVRRSIRISTVNADSRPRERNTTTAVSSLIQRQEDQQAPKTDNRPHSGESVALAEVALYNDISPRHTRQKGETRQKDVRSY
ncbi:hypothetical protein NDU88_005756 [Pleurodeles waltl]|uniref:Uncharacterized protein n=1 Tax=Pleurodeles waltl TaxID=8319 RepID=A0AAV7RJJ1_PLEWA|nr:hypothetical protein NDU88_005756 [Pleurodeles waltl]